MSPENPGLTASDDPTDVSDQRDRVPPRPRPPESPQGARRPRPAAAETTSGEKGRRRVRARRVKRIVRRVDPWSVLKISLLFYFALFLILCVASAVLWSAARNAGTVDQVEDFVTSLGFGNCENVDAEDPAATTTSVAAPASQAPPADGATTLAPSQAVPDTDTSDGDDCPAGQELVGEFQFEDTKIRDAALLGGLVLVVAGAAFNVVLALLFNLISELTGGVRLTVLEEETKPRPGSPDARASN